MSEESFIKELDKLNIKIGKKELDLFNIYKELLKEYNKKFNLTSIIEDNDIYLKHFFDSLYLLTIDEVRNSTSILDIGTGAGFPGIPLAIMLPSTKITLIESNNKKCGFLNIVKSSLNLDNVEIICTRAENYTKINREKFDIATSRAVANLSILLELEIPSLKVNGYFLPLKSNIFDELKDSNQIINDLNCKVEKIINYNLPIENSKRTILKIKKEKITSNKYPREYNKILKSIKK